MEIKSEADSNDITECSHDVKPSVGMFVFPPSQQLFVSVPFFIIFLVFWHFRNVIY